MLNFNSHNEPPFVALAVLLRTDFNYSSVSMLPAAKVALVALGKIQLLVLAIAGLADSVVLAF